MSNADYSEISSRKALSGRAVSPPKTGVKASSNPGFPEKPGPAGGLPGKGGPNRNPSGVGKRGKFHVKSEGI